MKLVYIAMPYTNPDPQTNYERFLQVSSLVIEAGHIPVSGTAWHPVYHLEKMRNVPYVRWLEMALELMSRCDLVVRLPGESNGADMEVLLAKKLGKRVLPMNDQLPERFISALRNFDR